jgi:protein O-GlcNAc transferase
MNSPNDQHAVLQQAIALHQAGRLGEAEQAYRAIIANDPRNAQAWNLLGALAHQLGHHSAAIELLEQSVALDSSNAQALNNLGEALRAVGEVEGSIAALRRAIELNPRYSKAHSNLLLTLHFDSATARPDQFLREHREWGSRHAGTLWSATPQAANRRDDGQLRIGYVSPDFKRHSVAYFIEPILGAHDRQKFHITCYSNTSGADEMTARIRQHADEWREIRGVSDDDAAEMIRRDGIDILIDLTGHMAGNRLLLFARKPAPIQVTYLGYPNTTGLAAMNYRLSDAIADPTGAADAHCVERLVRLPHGAWCFRPPVDAPDFRVERSVGPITFGSFNKLPKVRPAVMELWAEILRRVPDSRLIIKAKSLGDAGTREKTIALLERAGIARDRNTASGWEGDMRAHLDLYNSIDVALDTFPYNGTTTTCEALWMGTPVVTLAGDLHVARVGASLLHRAGLDELVATSPQQYVEMAVKLAEDRVRVAELRRTLRERIKNSSLTSAAIIAGDIEAAYQQMWQDHARP